MSRALVLIGSPKPKASASRSFGEAISERLEARGWETATARIAPAVRSADKLEDLLARIAEVDLVVLSFPLYIDTLPAPVTRLLEAWADRGIGDRTQRLAVLTQCGFPEASHCDTAVAVCRRFAAEVGVGWAGHLAFGMGGGIEGRKAEQSMISGRIAHLDAAAEALAVGAAIPDSAIVAFVKPLVPPWSYPLFGRFTWPAAARKNGCTEPLGYRRYAQARS